MTWPKIDDKVGGKCRVKPDRVAWAIRFHFAMVSSTSLRVRPKLLWRKASHCKRAVYRHYFDKGAEWEP